MGDEPGSNSCAHSEVEVASDQKLQEKGAAARARQREEHPFRPNLQASFASSVPMNKETGVDTDDKMAGIHSSMIVLLAFMTMMRRRRMVQRVAGVGAGAGAGGGDDIVVKIDIGNTHGAPPNESTGSKTTTESLQTEKHGAPLPPSDGRSLAADASASKNDRFNLTECGAAATLARFGAFSSKAHDGAAFLEASLIKAKREERQHGGSVSLKKPRIENAPSRPQCPRCVATQVAVSQ